MGVKFYATIKCTREYMVHRGRIDGYKAFFKLIHERKGVWYMCGCPTRQWELVKLILEFHQG
jgi:hypothetical protein